MGHKAHLVRRLFWSDVLAREQGFEIGDINFRDKRVGWKKSVSLSYTLHENAFMKGFLRNIYLRPSCYACPAKSGKSCSDITLADYWGNQHLMPEFDDDCGVSALTINTEKGQMAMRAIGAEIHSAPYEELCAKNPSLLHSCSIPTNRSRFLQQVRRDFINVLMMP